MTEKTVQENIQPSRRPTTESLETLLGEVAGEYFDRMTSGERPEIEEYVARYPEIAEQIRAAIESLGIPHKAATYHRHITLSIGVTSTLPTHDTQPESILIAADRAMYNAKHDGKNRVAYSTAARTGTYQSLIISNDSPTRPS